MPSVDWTRVPQFIREGVEDFPFLNATEAAEFLLLLVARVKSRLKDLPVAPRYGISTGFRADWSWDLYFEMVLALCLAYMLSTGIDQPSR